MDLELRDLLKKNDLDPSKVLILRHSPKEPRLMRAIPLLAAENSEAFNLYQSVQTPKVERQMGRATHVVAFVAQPQGLGLLVGLYENKGSKRITLPELKAKIAYRRLIDKGMSEEDRATFLHFDLHKMDMFDGLQGRLVVPWPPPAIQWSRWGDQSFPIRAIHDEDMLVPSLGSWDTIRLTCSDIKECPPSWKRTLTSFRGVYYIFDTVLCKGYVGAAFGAENIWGRWETHAKTGGDARQLRLSDPRNFLFTILQLVAQSTPKEQMEEIETSWKVRLHTREFGLNNN